MTISYLKYSIDIIMRLVLHKLRPNMYELGLLLYKLIVSIPELMVDST